MLDTHGGIECHEIARTKAEPQSWAEVELQEARVQAKKLMESGWSRRDIAMLAAAIATKHGLRITVPGAVDAAMMLAEEVDRRWP